MLCQLLSYFSRFFVLRLTELKLPLDHSLEDLEIALIKRLKIEASRLISYKLVKKSIDARCSERISLIYSLDVCVDRENALLKKFQRDHKIRKSPDNCYQNSIKAPKGFPRKKEDRPVIIGAGPCGYFSALLLAQMGFKPLLLERGESIKERTKQTFGFWKKNIPFNSYSNVQFGEGGAGTFSDGKLYSQISDPENYGRKVLDELVASGANPEILTLYRPHIGTFKLATVVRGLRSRIEALGGEVRFQNKMEELLVEESTTNNNQDKNLQVVGIKLGDGSVISTRHLILALGHSARDSFEMLEQVGVSIEQKLFSVGFRIEHPQVLIDRDRWGSMAGHPKLGHAEYKLVHHSKNGRCVYSFCMCPGGFVVGATSEEGCVVTNGMSQHSRNERNANSALVVNLLREDFLKYERWPGDPLAGIILQRELEHNAFKLAGNNYFAPAQLLQDFLDDKTSMKIGNVQPSYLPGITLSNLNRSLPAPLIEAIKEAIPEFSKKIQSFDIPDALLIGVETRTSSPIRLPRDESLESINTKGLIPAGEGAGYAGGILSAGIDGIKAAEAMALKILSKY